VLEGSWSFCFYCVERTRVFFINVADIICSLIAADCQSLRFYSLAGILLAKNQYPDLNVSRLGGRQTVG
jgi:hypothetical protein